MNVQYEKIEWLVDEEQDERLEFSDPFEILAAIEDEFGVAIIHIKLN